MGFARTQGLIGLVTSVVLLTACGGGAPGGRPTQGSSARRTGSRPLLEDPPSFVYVTSGTQGLRSRVELRSPATGRLVKRLATFGESFTDNGLALSPDRADVYVSLIGRRSLRIVRISVRDRKRTIVAAGEQPAVSPDGRRLAYIVTRRERSQTLAVRDLSSGRTRRIGLRRLVGRSAELLNGTVTWLGDGSDVVAIPGPVAYAAAGEPGGGHGTCASGTCLIVVHLSGRRLTADRIVLRRAPDAVMNWAGDSSRPRSLLLADGSGRRTTVVRVALHGSRAHVTPLLSLPADTMPMAFSPSGARLLYLVGHSPPALWVADLARGRLAHPHRLLRDARLDEAAW